MDRKTTTGSETAYRGKLRDYSKTRTSLRTVYVLEELAKDLWLRRQDGLQAQGLNLPEFVQAQ
jgi:hypothetical protein